VRRKTAQAIDLPSGQFARVCDLSSCDRTDGRSFHCRYRSSVPVECRELHLEGLAVGVDVNNSPDVADLQALVGHRRSQNDPIMFSDHFESSLLARIGRHESRTAVAAVDNPDRSDQPLSALFSVCRQPSIDNMFSPCFSLL
jgi:hypothetical protein